MSNIYILVKYGGSSTSIGQVYEAVVIHFLDKIQYQLRTIVLPLCGTLPRNAAICFKKLTQLLMGNLYARFVNNYLIRAIPILKHERR